MLRINLFLLLYWNIFHLLQCVKADVFSLRLLASLADRASVPLNSSGSIQQLPVVFGQSLSTLSTLSQMTAMTEAIVYTSIASEGSNPMGISSTTDLEIDPSSAATMFGKSCLSPLLDKLSSCITTTSDNDTLSLTLQHLSHAAGTCPSLLAGDLQVFSTLVQTCLSVAHSTLLQVSTQLAALQVLSILCSNHDVKRRILHTPQGASVYSLLLSDQGVFFLCVRFCVDGIGDNILDWALDPPLLVEDTVWEDDDSALFAEVLLGSFLRSLAQSLPTILPMVEAMLSRNDWKHQRAGLSILEQCVHSAPVRFGPFIPTAIDAALSLYNTASSSLRVQYQALMLLGVVCEHTTVTHGARILEVMVQGLASPCAKLSAAGSLALVSYGRGVKETAETMLVPFLQDVLSALIHGPLSLPISKGTLVDSSAVVVQVRAIGAVAVLADSSGTAFRSYYPQVMPGLLACAKMDSNHEEILQLRGAALEAMTIVGQAIGDDNLEMYLYDAGQVMGLAIPLLQSDSTSIPMDQILSACARVAAVMGDQYVPFVESVLPHLLKRLQDPAELEFSEGDDAGLLSTRLGQVDQDDGVESTTIALPGRGLTKVSINVTKIQEKALAARAVFEHADALGAAFGPYVQSTLQVMIPLISFQYSGEVRSTVAQACGAVFHSACLHGKESGDISLAQECLPVLSKVICKQMHLEDTSDMEVVFALAESLSDVLRSAYHQICLGDRSVIVKFSVDNGREGVTLLMQLMTACLNRRGFFVQTLEGRKGVLSGDDERHELTEALEKEQEVLTPLVDSVGYTLKFFRERFVPIFEELVAPILGPYLQTGYSFDVRAKFAAICLFDDVVEHCGSAAAHKYSVILSEALLIGIDNSTNGGDEEVKQVSLYGLAQIARYGSTSVLESHALDLIQKLLTIADTSKDDAENVFIVENAVSALASLALFEKSPFGNMKEINRGTILSVVLNQLPLRQDEEEAKICHSSFGSMVEKGLISLTAETAQILRIIGETLAYIDDGEDLATPETQTTFAEILFQMTRDIESIHMQKAYQKLPSEVQYSLNTFLDQRSK